MALGKYLKLTVCGIMAGLGVLCLVAFYGELSARSIGLGLEADSMPDSIDEMRVPVLAAGPAYESLAEHALAIRPMNLRIAREASLKSLAIDSMNVTAWNRLAYIDLAANGRVTRNGLAALYQSYEISPFGNPQVMMWRVDFATQVWPSLPDDLRAMTLAQIPVLGRMHSTWDWRIETCRYNPHEAIHSRACAIAPGTVRPRQAPSSLR